MASNRRDINNPPQGRPLKPTLASTRTARAAVAPRLAHNNSTTNTHSNGSQVSSTSTSTATASTISRRATPKLADPAHKQTLPLQPPFEERDTPVKSFLATNVTPRSSSRKSRVDSTNSTPVADDTPSQLRAKASSPPASHAIRRQRSSEDMRPHTGTLRPRSLVVGNGSDRGSVKSSTCSVRAKSPGYLRPTEAQHAQPARTTKDSSSMFFRADEVKSQPATTKNNKRPPPLKKAATFLYANGREERDRLTTTPPLLSPHSYSHPRSHPQPSVLSTSETSSTPPLLSPPLSAVSARSPGFPPPPTSQVRTPTFAISSSPGDGIHLSYRGGASQILSHGLRPHAAMSGGPATSPSSIISDRFPFPNQPRLRPITVPRNSALGPGHAKSSSLSSIDATSPNQARRRSATTSELAALKQLLPAQPTSAPDVADPNLDELDDLDDDDEPNDQQSTGRLSLDSLDTTSPLQDQSLASGSTNAVPDLAAKARRERKVMDLEISNSSLLAINKSLEREIRKQKSELKRYRRLSRAGQFAVPPTDTRPMARLEEEGDANEGDLGPINTTVGRPSSPFMSHPTSDQEHSTDEDDQNSDLSGNPSSLGGNDAKRRAADEAHLRHDLSRHRELLLDTQRMNQSLQRCLTWTEDLIKGGRKALEYQVRGEDVKLGGRILAADDDDISTQADDDCLSRSEDYDISSPQYARERDTMLRGAITPDPGVQRWADEGAKDSAVEFGKPSVLRSPLKPVALKMASSNPNIPLLRTFGSMV